MFWHYAEQGLALTPCHIKEIPRFARDEVESYYFFKEFIMPTTCDALKLPLYQTFVDSIAVLSLPFSGSELHGIMCGYLSAGAAREGMVYLRTLVANLNDPEMKSAILALFQVYTVSQHQIESFGFELQLLLLDEDEPLERRGQSFSDWCEGFTQGFRMAGVDYHDLEDDDTQDALQHISEFADMDYQSLHLDEESERALAEITEYTRMAVLHIHSDLQANRTDKDDAETEH